MSQNSDEDDASSVGAKNGFNLTQEDFSNVADAFGSEPLFGDRSILEKVSGFLPTMDDGPLLATKDY
jgi:hypothetical protein